MEISFSSNSITDDHIATFGTCHDSPVVVPCAKYCSDHLISVWMRAKWNFHYIWIVMEKLLVKWAPETWKEFSCHDVVMDWRINIARPGWINIGPWEIWPQSRISKFQTHFNDKYLKYFLWNCYHVKVTTPHWSLVIIGSGNGLVSSGNKPLPEPMLT